MRSRMVLCLVSALSIHLSAIATCSEYGFYSHETSFQGADLIQDDLSQQNPTRVSKSSDDSLKATTTSQGEGLGRKESTQNKPAQASKSSNDSHKATATSQGEDLGRKESTQNKPAQASKSSNDSYKATATSQGEDLGRKKSTQNKPRQTSKTSSDSLSSTTVLLGALNNAIETESNNLNKITVIIGLLGLLFVILGWWSFNDLKDDFKDYKIDSDYRINSQIEAYKAFQTKLSIDNSIFQNSIRKQCSNSETKIQEYIKDQNSQFAQQITESQKCLSEVRDKSEEIVEIVSKQKRQDIYLQKINEYQFIIANSITDAYQNVSASEGQTNVLNPQALREKLYHHYYNIIILLPLPDKEFIPAFDYLKSHGTEVDIEELQFIAENDIDDNKKRLALETIGFINGKLYGSTQKETLTETESHPSEAHHATIIPEENAGDHTTVNQSNQHGEKQSPQAEDETPEETEDGQSPQAEDETPEETKDGKSSKAEATTPEET